MDKVNNWLQVVSNLGIVLGLILVAVQLNQDSKFNQSQIQSQHNVFRENQQIALGENFAATRARLARGNASEITDEDLLLYHFYVNTYVSQLLTLKSFSERGYLENDAYEWMATSAIVCGLFDGDVGMTYLDVMGYEDDIGVTIRNTLETCREDRKARGIEETSFWAHYLQSMRAGLSKQN